MKKYCLPMSDYEEHSIDVESQSKSLICQFVTWRRPCRNHRPMVNNQWNYCKDPLPLFSKSPSWFKYEELIDDWLDLKQVDAGKREPASKNRFVGVHINVQGTS